MQVIVVVPDHRDHSTIANMPMLDLKATVANMDTTVHKGAEVQ